MSQRGLGTTHHTSAPSIRAGSVKLVVSGTLIGLLFRTYAATAAASTTGANGYPSVNDTLRRIFISIHAYMYYTDWQSMGWNNSTADFVAEKYYQTTRVRTVLAGRA